MSSIKGKKAKFIYMVIMSDGTEKLFYVGDNERSYITTLMRRVENGVFRPYRLDNNQFIWTDQDLQEVKNRNRMEQMGMIKGAK